MPLTPSQILALIRDVAIVGALAFVVYRIYTDGANAVKVADMKAVQKQLDANTQTVARWSQEASDAQKQRTQDLSTIHDAIAAHSQPIVVLRDRPASAGTVPSPSATPGSQPAACGSADRGSGKDTVDIRPDISAFETKYEGALAECRAAIASWPH